MQTLRSADEAAPLHPGVPPVINNRYRLHEKLGQGMLGVAFRATDTLEDREVAIKVIHLEALAKDMSAYLRHEFQAMSRLRHPNIVQVLDFDRIEGTSMSFFSMEYVKGKDFVSAVRDLPFDDLYAAIVQVCRALEYIHSRGILHCDIKPINLACTRTAQGLTPKLMDFHLSREKKAFLSGSVQGTLNYMSPEVINQGMVDKRADLYSFGVVLYEAVCGRVPFKASNAIALLRMHLETEAEPPRTHRPDCPPVLEHIILKLLQKDPSRRYASANQIVQEINRSTGRDFALETPRTMESYILSGRFTGRALELTALANETASWSGLAPAATPPPRPAAASAPSLSPSPAAAGEGRGGGRFAAPSAPARTPLPAPLRTPAPAPAPTPPATPAPPLPAHRGFAASVATAPQFALVAGEAGVGKTRLLTEFKIHCQVRGIKVFRGDCYEETARAYGPLLQVFRAVGRAFSPDAEGIRRKLPELGRVLGYLTFSRAVAPGSPSGLFEQRAAILDGIARLLTRVAGEMPFVIWLENLQWADVETVEALRHLLRLAAPSTEDGEPDSPRLAAGDAPLPVLLAATVREAEATGRPAEGLLRELQAHAVRREAGDALPVLWVQLDGLARPAVTDLVASMLGLDEVPEELVARVHAASGGNPMKVETFMRILLAEQILRHTAGSWSVDLEALARLPAVEDLSRLLDFDLEGLPKTAREILSCLAALDRPEPLPVLRAAVKGADDAFYSALFELVSRRLVSDDLVENEVRYQLGVVPRRPLLAGLGARGARQALHRRIADALATAHAEAPEEHAAEIARHLRLAGNDATQRRKLVKVAQMAGREARRVLALGAAREHFGVALAAARGLRLGARALADLRLALGEVCHELGDLPGALAAYRAALRGVGRERERAEIALLLGKSLERGGDYPGALYQVEKARAGFERDGDAEGTARACLEIAWLRGYRLCRFEEGSEFCARALRLLEGKKAVETQIRAFTVLGAVHQTAGQWEESLRCHQRALELRRRSEDRFELPSALNNVGLTYFLKGDALGARDYAREGVERVVGSERPGLHGTLLSTLANCHFALGAWSEARADWARAREIAERIGDRRRIAVSCAYLGALAHAQGDASSAIDLLMRAILILRDLGLALEQREVYLKLAGVNRDLGAFEAAADDVRAAGAQAASNRFLDALTDRCCARLAHLRGDLSAADGGYRKVLRAFTRMGLAREKSEALADLAEVQLEQGARRKAQLTAGRAERLAESLSFQEGRVRAVFARANAEALLALERRDTQVRGDTEESEESESERRVRAALAVAEGMGARWLVWQGRWAHARCAAARGMAAAAGPRYRAAESALAEIATRVPEHLRDGLAAIPRIREFTREAARYR